MRLRTTLVLLFAAIQKAAKTYLAGANRVQLTLVPEGEK
jgi:hypothetical protein